MSLVANITAIKNVPLSVNMSSIFPEYINTYVGGKIGTSSVSFTIPSWLTITETETVNNLVNPFDNLDDNISYSTFLINGTDYLKQFTVNIQVAGQFRLLFYEYKKTGLVTNPISVSIGIINISVVEPPPPIEYSIEVDEILFVIPAPPFAWLSLAPPSEPFAPAPPPPPNER